MVYVYLYARDREQKINSFRDASCNFPSCVWAFRGQSWSHTSCHGLGDDAQQEKGLSCFPLRLPQAPPSPLLVLALVGLTGLRAASLGLTKGVGRLFQKFKVVSG